MKIDTGNKEIDELLTRGVGEFIDPDGSFVKKLKENPKKIIIKFGVDPTRPDIHLGHAVVLKKLRQFQDLGCKVIFLVGDYTAQIGDPTGKSKVRPEIDQAEVSRNMETYMSQVGKILIKDNPNVFDWIRNSDWFTAITDIELPKNSTVSFSVERQDGSIIKFENIDANSSIGKSYKFEETRMQRLIPGIKELQIITLKSFLWSLKHITYAQLIKRDLFDERIKNKQDLYMHELMYPVLQGIDSYVLAKIYNSCDLEAGGTDQTFNMLMGRDIMKTNKQIPQAVISFKILEGLDGKEKMSKSLDNYVGITDEPSNMYGKIMSIPDTSMINYFELCTSISLDEIENIKLSLEDKKINPKDIKMRLAKQIVSDYHGEKKAQEAEDQFKKTFSEGGVPDDIKKVNINIKMPLVDILINNGMVESKSEFRRLVEEGAIKFHVNMEEKKIIDPNSLIENDGVIKIGKKRFIHITVQKK